MRRWVEHKQHELPGKKINLWWATVNAIWEWQTSVWRLNYLLTWSSRTLDKMVNGWAIDTLRRGDRWQPHGLHLLSERKSAVTMWLMEQVRTYRFHMSGVNKKQGHARVVQLWLFFLFFLLFNHQATLQLFSCSRKKRFINCNKLPLIGALLGPSTQLVSRSFYLCRSKKCKCHTGIK